MAVNKVKCKNCNIVISEVLAFIQNKHDVMDNESIIRVCLSAFSEPDIQEAKDLFFGSITTSQRQKSRRKDGKKQRDLEDIICLIKEVDPNDIPIFVARNLQKLPPVCFDHIDVTKLLRDIVILRSEIQNIKENYATNYQLQEVSNQLENLKLTSLEDYQNNQNINTRKRGGFVLDSKPVGLAHFITTDLRPTDMQHLLDKQPSAGASDCDDGYMRCEEEIHGSKNSATTTTCEQSHYSIKDNIECGEVEMSVTEPAVELSESAVKQTASSNRADIITSQISMAEIVKRPGDWKHNEPSEEWIQVQRNRHKNRFVGQMGKAVNQNEVKFKAAESRVSLFISNVNKETSENDIREYIKSKKQEIISVEKINTKKEKTYNSFKIFVSRNKADAFLDDSFWPNGITFRKFIYFKHRSVQQEANKPLMSTTNTSPNNE